jgi:lipoyl-dependent peroxiredoxin
MAMGGGKSRIPSRSVSDRQRLKIGRCLAIGKAISCPGCFTMALSLILGEAQLTAEHIDTTAEVSLDKVDGGYAISAVHLTLKAKIPGADSSKFVKLANIAKANCPVSKLLNAKVTLDADLVD